MCFIKCQRLCYSFYIDAFSKKDDRKEIFTWLKMRVTEINGKFKLKVKVDMGANANILTMGAFKQKYPNKEENEEPIPDLPYIQVRY